MPPSKQFPAVAGRIGLALAAVITLGTLDAATPAGAEGIWGAHYSGTSGGTNCGFFS